MPFAVFQTYKSFFAMLTSLSPLVVVRPSVLSESGGSCGAFLASVAFESELRWIFMFMFCSCLAVEFGGLAIDW
jgi:hypothetical protein